MQKEILSENQQEVKKIEQGVGISKSLMINIIVGVVAAAVVGAGVYVYTAAENKKTQENLLSQIQTLQTQIKGLQSEKVKETEKEINVNAVGIDTTDWQTYRNEDLGFEFQYPLSWGEVKLEERDCLDSGSLYRGAFSKNDSITFGGDSINCIEGRGAGFLDFTYYAFSPSNPQEVIYHYSNLSNQQDKITLSEIMVISGQDQAILIYNQDLGLMIQANDLGALINLKIKKYPGLAFEYQRADKEKIDLFKRILSTFKFTEEKE